MGIEYRVEGCAFDAAAIAAGLRLRGFVVRENDRGFEVRAAEGATGMPEVEVVAHEGEVTCVVYGGAPDFVERVVGATMLLVLRDEERVTLVNL